MIGFQTMTVSKVARWFWVVCVLINLPVLEARELPENVRRYHSLLLKKPGNEILYQRFVGAWLDADSEKATREDLEEWLTEKAATGSPEAAFILAKFHAGEGNPEEAMKALDRAIEKSGAKRLPGVHLERAKLWADLLEFEKGLEDLQGLDSEDAVRLRGMILLRLERPDEAVAEWDRLLAEAPEDEGLWEDLIELKLREGLMEDAMKTATGLIARSRDPYKREVRRLRLADIQLQAGEKEAGLASLEKVLAATGDGTWLEREVLAQVERIYLREDDAIGLRDYYQKLREIHPQRVSIRKALARRMAANGEMAEAVEMFREVLKITPGDAGNWEEFITFLEMSERWAEVRDEVSAFLKGREGDFILWERLARVERKLDHKEGSMLALKEVEKLRVGSPEGVVAVARLYQGVLEKDEAERVLREGSRRFPEAVEVVEALAAVLVELDRKEEAKTLWLTLVKGGAREDLLRVARSLAGHGMVAEAFDLLQSRAEDFNEDPLVLGQLCRLALEKDLATRAVPYALKMVGLAKSPTDLEAGVNLAEGVIRRAGMEEEVIQKLKKEARPGAGLLCLQAQMLMRAGDVTEAQGLLDRAEKSAENAERIGLFLVGLAQRSGDLAEAIRRQTAIVDAAKGRKTVSLKKLVKLLRESGDLAASLQRVEEWKKVAPGDRQAWLARAELLIDSGRSGEAVKELRRMIGRFGGEVASRERLAGAYEADGDPAGAVRIYRRLYEQAEQVDARAGWIRKWTDLAQREGFTDEVISEFEKRRVSNPRAVSPLLALVEIYQQLGRDDEARTMWKEIAKLRLQDSGLLLKIAKAANQRGDWKEAEAIYRKAVEADRGTTAKEALIAALMKRGQTASALALMQSLPEGSRNAWEIEKTIVALIEAGKLVLAGDYLNEEAGRFPEDWRLKYLQGILHDQAGRTHEADRIFREIEGVTNELPRLAQLPKVSGSNFENFFHHQPYLQLGSREIEILGYTLHHLGRIKIKLSQPAKEQGWGSGYSTSGSSIELNLPRSMKAARTVGFLWPLRNLQKLPDDQKVALFDLMLEGAEGDRRWFLLLQASRREQFENELRAELTRQPGNLKLSRLWLGAIANRGEKALDSETKAMNQRALRVFADQMPLECLGCLPHMVSLGLLSPQQAEEWVPKLFARLSQSEKASQLRMLFDLASFYRGPSHQEVDERKNLGGSDTLKRFLVRELYDLEPGHLADSLLFMRVINEALSREDGAGAVSGINLMIRNNEVIRKKNGGQASRSRFSNLPTGYFQFSILNRQSNQFRPLLPGRGLYGFYFSSLLHFKEEKRLRGTARYLAEDEEVEKPLEGLDLPDELKAFTRVKDPLEIIRPHVAGITNPVVRAAFMVRLKMDAELKILVTQLTKSKVPDNLFLAAAWFYEAGDLEKSFQTLLALRKLKLKRAERRYLDLALVTVGALCAEVWKKNPDRSDDSKAEIIELSQEILLKRIKGGSVVREIDEKRIMISLGMEEELATYQKKAERVAAARRLRSQRSYHFQRRNRQREPVKALLEKGRSKDAVRTMASSVSSLLRGGAGRDRLAKSMKPLIDAGLIGDLLAELEKTLLDNVDESAFRNYLEVAVASRQIERLTKTCREILMARPAHQTAAVALFLYGGSGEKDWAQFSLKQNPESALPKIKILQSLLAGEIRGVRVKVDLNELHLVLQATTYFFKESEGLKAQDLSWVLTMVSRAKQKHNELHLDQETPREVVQKLGVATRRLLEMALKEPLLNVRIFSDMVRSREMLELKDEELIEAAHRSLRISLENRPDAPSDRESRVARLRFENSNPLSDGWHRENGAYHFLLRCSKKRMKEVIRPELLGSLEKKAPFVAMRHRIVMRLLMAKEEQEAAEAYENWKEKMAVDEEGFRLQSPQMVKLIVALALPSAAWVDVFENDLVSWFLAKKNQSLSGDDLAAWLVYREKAHGVGALRRGLQKIYTEAYGPRKNWVILDRLSQKKTPPSLRHRKSAMETLIGSLNRYQDIQLPLYEFFLEEGLFRNPAAALEAIVSEWTSQGRSGEALQKLEKEHRLLAAAPPTPARLVIVSHLFSRAPFSEKLDEKEFGYFTELQGPEIAPIFQPLMLHWFRARLGLSNRLPELLEKHHLLVGKARALDPEFGSNLSDLLSREEARIGPKMGKLLKTIEDNERRQALANLNRMTAFFLDENEKAYPDRADWALLVRAADLAPLEAGEIANRFIAALEEKALGDFRLIHEGRFQRAGPLAYWGRLIRETLAIESARPVLVNRTVFLDSLFRGPLGDRFIYGDYTNYSLRPIFDSALSAAYQELQKKHGREGKVRAGVTALLPTLKKLDRRQRETFIAIYADWIFDQFRTRSPDLPEDLKWMKEVIPPELSDIHDLFLVLTASSLQGRADKQLMATAHREGREACLRFFNEARLSRVLLLRLWQRILADTTIRKMCQGPELVDLLVRDLSPQTGDPVHLMFQLVKELNKIEPGAIADHYSKFDGLVRDLLTVQVPDNHQYGRRTLLRNSVEKRVRRSEWSSARKFIMIEPKLFNGRVDLIWALHQSGEKDPLLQLLGPPGTLMRCNPPPVFNPENAASLDRLLVLLPEDRRFQVEVILNRGKTRAGDGEPLPSRSERMIALARRFVAEAPLDNASRLRILNYLAYCPEALVHVAAEARAEVRDSLLGQIVAEGGASMRDRLSLMEALIRLEIIAGRDQEVQDHLASLINNRVGDQSLNSMYAARLLKAWRRELWQRVEKETQKREAMARDLIAPLQKLRSQLRAPAARPLPDLEREITGLLFLAHLWSRDEEDSPDEITAETLRALVADLPEGAKAKTAILEALLASAKVQKLVLKDSRVLQETFWRRFADVPEILDLVAALPETAPALHCYLWRFARMHRDSLQRIPHLKKAHRLAVARDELQTSHEILVDQVIALSQSEQGQAALALAEKIDRDLIPERRATLETVLESLKNPSQE